MAKINISFNGSIYSIEESLFADAISSLANHCSQLEIDSVPAVPAGLYVDGVMTESWDELLADGTVNVANGRLVTQFDSENMYNSAKPKLTGDLILPEDGSITIIDDYAFCYCSKLTSITIPNGVTSIGVWAFNGCSSLTSVTIPNSVTNIVHHSFQSCENLEEINFNGTIQSWNDIQKGEQWNNYVPATYVQCSDGQIAL